MLSGLIHDHTLALCLCAGLYHHAGRCLTVVGVLLIYCHHCLALTSGLPKMEGWEWGGALSCSVGKVNISHAGSTVPLLLIHYQSQLPSKQPSHYIVMVMQIKSGQLNTANSACSLMKGANSTLQ